MNLDRLLMPDFLGIGAMRSGTTWLVRVLRTHPEVWMSRRKEVHFFDRRLERGRIPFLPEWEAKARYATFFLEGRLRRRKVAGEITPEYVLLGDDELALVHRWMPDLKIVFMMRDPVERGWSHIRKDASEPERKLPGDPTVDEMLRFLDHPDIRMRGDYPSCIRRWQEYYAPERFCYLFLEEIEQDPGPSLRRLAEFLGVDPDHAYDPALVGSRQNARPDDGMPDRVRHHLEQQFRGDVADTEALVGRAVPWR